jgi:hypothetical protein
MFIHDKRDYFNLPIMNNAVPVSLKKSAMVRGSFFSMGTEIFTFLDK